MEETSHGFLQGKRLAVLFDMTINTGDLATGYSDLLTKADSWATTNTVLISYTSKWSEKKYSTTQAFAPKMKKPAGTATLKIP